MWVYLGSKHCIMHTRLPYRARVWSSEGEKHADAPAHEPSLLFTARTGLVPDLPIVRGKVT